MSYIKHTWVTGEKITDDKLNNMEDGIKNIESDLILQQEEEPESDANKIWFPDSEPSEQLVPTYAEHQALATRVTNVEQNAVGSVKYSAAQSLTDEQKAQARSNIGLGDISSLVDGVVRFNEAQNLTDAQKEQVQENIGLDNIGSLVTGTVKYDQAQQLTTAEKQQARENIGLGDIDGMTGAVKYTADQDLTANQKSRARTNIDAANSADVASIGTRVTATEAAITNQTNSIGVINSTLNGAGIVADVTAEGDEITVSYRNGNTETYSIAGGMAFDSGYVDQNNFLHLSLNGVDVQGFEPFVLPASGGGGGSSYSVRIINHMGSGTMTVASTQRTYLDFTYVEYYGSDVEVSTGFMTVQYKLSTESSWNTYISNQIVSSNARQHLEVTSLLTSNATTEVRIVCSNGRQGDDAASRTLQFNISSVALVISSTFNSTATYTGNFSFPYSCVGRNISKVVYFYIDGTEYTHVDVGTSNNQSLQIQVNLVGNYSYGSHIAKVWFETPQGASSNVITFPILYNSGTSSAPIIGATLADEVIEYGETLYLNYVCYTPGQETTDELNIRVYAEEDGEEVEYYNTDFENIPNNTQSVLPINAYPELGTAYVEMTSGATTVTLEFEVTEIQTEYDIRQITSNLVYSYRPIGYTNNSANKETYVYNFSDAAGNNRNVYTHMNGFNWVTDGYLDGESLTLSGSARAVINLPILTTSFTNEDEETVVLDSETGATVTTGGRTIEFEFELENVTDQNSVVFKYLSYDANDHRVGGGFVITPQVCYMLSDGQEPILDSTGFIENEESIPCAYLKDEKRIRISFVIEKKLFADTRFVSYVNVFINGEYANSYLYDPNAIYDGEAQIEIGSNDCVTKLYDVRMYNRGLTKEEVLQNHMNSDVDIRNRIVENEFNDILTQSGDVDYIKAVYKYPCLLFIGNLSNFKDDRQYVGVRLTKPDGRGGYSEEFELLDQDDSNKFVSSIKVQGTSSQRFMRKNFKVYLVKNKQDGTGTEKVKYALKGYDDNHEPLSIAESTLCFKMDYMSTDHANTFNSNIADTLFNDKPAGSLVQNTVYGFRCLLFHMAQEDYMEGVPYENYSEGVIEFAGDGCLNNDKSNSKTFGLETSGDSGADTTKQKWEFKDNSNPLCPFKTDRMMQKIYAQDGVTYKRQARNGLESCYPDEGDLDKAGIEPDYSHIQVLFTWVCQRANFWDASTTSGTGGTYNGQSYSNERDLKKAIFRNEFTRHFNMEHALVYYLFIEWVALCDNRAKNMFLSCKNVHEEQLSFTGAQTSIWDCVDMESGQVYANRIDWENSTFDIWYTDLYDLDSCFGAENSGYIRIPYYADWNYQLGRSGDYQFNGHDSRLWCMFEEAFADEIKARAKLITRDNTGSGALNYGVLKNVHITNNAELVCPAVVNRDMVYKYEDAWTQGYWDYSVDPQNPVWVQTNAYKYLQRGSRTEQKESFIYRRCNMLYSKYECDQFKNDRLAFRCGAAVAKADTEIQLSAIQAMWLGVQYGDSGSAIMSNKKMAGETATISAPDGLGRSDNCYIFGASNLTSVSSLAKFYPYEIGLTNCGKLKTLLIGSDDPGYSNGSLSALDTSSCALLDTLNIQGCTGFTDTPINLTQNTLIREVYASGSTVPYFTFANGGILETLELGTPKRIVLLNMSYMQNLSYDNLNQLVMLRIENTPNVGVLDILDERLGDLRLGIRLVGIEETVHDRNYEMLRRLASSEAQGKRLDANGNLIQDATAYPVITGTIHCDYVGSAIKAKLAQIYPDLIIDNSYPEIVERTVTFVDWDGSPIIDKDGNEYVQYIEQGSQAHDPIQSDEVDTPTRQQTAQYSYVFSSWDNLSGAVTSNRTVTATYTETIRSYTVRWFSQAGMKLKEVTTNYGTEVVYNNDPHVFPELTDEESNYVYKVFKGWNKSTGFITEDTDVYAIWERAELPSVGKDLEDMNIAEIYGVAKRKLADTYWDYKDHFDFTLGRDYAFENVQSQLILEDRYIDGTDAGIVRTNIKLFDENAPSFTLAIDYEVAKDVLDQTLVSCFDSNGSEGFRLMYNTNPYIQWGDKSQTVGYKGQRNIVVLRHRQGSNSLFVYAPNQDAGLYLDTATAIELVRSRDTQTDATLMFGGIPFGDSGVDSKATCWIHWCKIWYADLGPTDSQSLAKWPHEQWRAQYYGAGRYRYSGETIENSGASFVLENILSYTHRMNETADNAGGWDQSEMRAFVQSKCFDALPIYLQAILSSVKIKATAGARSSEVVTSDDKLYLMAYSEAASMNTEPYASEGSQDDRGTKYVPWFSSNWTRAKLCGKFMKDNPQVITHSSEPTSLSDPYTVTTGDIWIYTGGSNRLLVYMGPEVTSKHWYVAGSYFDGTRWYNPSEESYGFVAAAGGAWLQVCSYWLRSPNATNDVAFANVTRTGSAGSGNSASGRRGIWLGFSI